MREQVNRSLEPLRSASGSQAAYLLATQHLQFLGLRLDLAIDKEYILIRTASVAPKVLITLPARTSF